MKHPKETKHGLMDSDIVKPTWTIDRLPFTEKEQKDIDRQGFLDEETWDMDTTIADFTLPRIRRFRELANGYPCHPSGKQNDFDSLEDFQKAIDKMIVWLEYIERGDLNPTIEVSEGKRLFFEYFEHLWW